MWKGKIVLFCVVSVAALGLCAGPARADLVEYNLTGTAQGGFDQVQVNAAWFYNVNAASTGSGVIQSFVRIQTNDNVEEGYNTSYRPLQFDENNSPTFTHQLLFSDVPVVNIGGTDYREFLLDINQDKTGDGRFLSLDKLQLFQGGAGNLHNYPTGLGTQVYDLDTADHNNWILLDFALNHGSGSGDMFAYIPNSLFGTGDYVYLYSEFGVENPNNGGFEEWAVRNPTTPPPPVPVPGAVLLGFLGLVAAGLKLRQYA